MHAVPSDRHDDPSRSERARKLREERREAYADSDVIRLFERLGYDLTDPNEVTRLNENLRYTERQRRRLERLESNKLGWIVSVVLLCIGAALTTMVQWANSFAKGH